MTATHSSGESYSAGQPTAPADRSGQRRVPRSGASGRVTGRRSRRRGIAAVEFAILAPFMTIVVLGTFELARGIMVKQVLNDAARRGCRIGIQPMKANSDVTSGINNILTDNGFSSSIATIKIQVNGATVDCSTAVQNDKVSVKVSIPTSSTFWISHYFLQSTEIVSDAITMLRQD